MERTAQETEEDRQAVAGRDKPAEDGVGEAAAPGHQGCQRDVGGDGAEVTASAGGKEGEQGGGQEGRMLHSPTRLVIHKLSGDEEGHS